MVLQFVGPYVPGQALHEAVKRWPVHVTRCMAVLVQLKVSQHGCCRACCQKRVGNMLHAATQQQQFYQSLVVTASSSSQDKHVAYTQVVMIALQDMYVGGIYGACCAQSCFG